MIRFAICDDDKDFSTQFAKLVKDEYQKCVEYGEKIECKIYNRAQDILENYSKDCIDVFFLDIEFGDTLGMDVARTLNKDIDNVGVVYVTNHVHYAPKAYVCRPLGFVRKSFVEEDIKLMIASVKEYLDKTRKRYCFYDNRKRFNALLNEVYFIQMQGHNMSIVTTESEMIMRDRISRVESDLLGQGFVKVNRSCMVNMRYIEDMDDSDVFIKNKGKLQISLRKKQEVYDKWQLYMAKHN